MIKSNINLSLVNATISISAIIAIELKDVQMIMLESIYNVIIQDYYIIDEVKHPIEQRIVYLTFERIQEIRLANPEMSEKDVFYIALLEKTQQDKPYGSASENWEINN